MREKQGIYWWISAVSMCVALMGMTLQPDLLAADVDGDGLDDAWESANGYSVLLKTHIVHVDAVNGDDVTGDGVTAATALKSIGAALSSGLFAAGEENVVLAAAGTYTGPANRELDFNGKDIWLRGALGAGSTLVDLEESGRFLALSHGETAASRLEGFTIRNGYKAMYGTAVHLSGSSMSIRDCVFENNRSGRKVVFDYGGGIVQSWWEDADTTAAVYAENAAVHLYGCVFRGNHSSPAMWSGPGLSMGLDNAGALFLTRADGSTVEDCSFLGNSGQGAGAVAI